jgi:hypothetical protein
MDGGGAFAVHPLPVRGVERPDAVELEAAARADARFFQVNRIKRFDGMEPNVRKTRRNRE